MRPLSHRCAMPAPPKGGAFAVTAKYPAKPQTFRQRKKAPPERKDFPRSGEDVAQRQIGESGRDQRERTERVQAGTAPLPSAHFVRSHPLPTLSLTRHLSPAGESLSKGTALGGDGKLSGIAKRRPLGGAGTAQAVTEGVLPQALTKGVTQKTPPQA